LLYENKNIIKIDIIINLRMNTIKTVINIKIFISISICIFNLSSKNKVNSFGLNKAYIRGINEEIDKNSNMLEIKIAINTINLLLLNRFVISKKELI
tara:strand:- start:3859 stop:4149 length:291 start_codon:yes stop_codon:yes gene_type:complete